MHKHREQILFLFLVLALRLIYPVFCLSHKCDPGLRDLATFVLQRKKLTIKLMCMQFPNLKLDDHWLFGQVFVKELEWLHIVFSQKSLFMSDGVRNLNSSYQEWGNRPCPSCFEPLYHSEAWCTTIDMKLI